MQQSLKAQGPMIECAEQVTLRGIILSSSLTLVNPHSLLAVVFEVESHPSVLEVEPMRGMLLQGDQKVIKMRVKREERAALQQQHGATYTMNVTTSYFCEYNKKRMAAMALRGWSKISQKIETNTIRICLDPTQPQDSRYSAPKTHSNSFDKFRDNSVKRSTKNSKLNDDLLFIFHNEQFKKSQPPPQKASEQRMFKMFASGAAMSEVQKTPRPMSQADPQSSEVQQYSNILESLKTKRPSQMSQPHFPAPVMGNNRAVELIILAILAAVFVTLGESVRQLFGN